ncbi:hypothetical protein ABZP36_004339 [Zizania latifolia]
MAGCWVTCEPWRRPGWALEARRGGTDGELDRGDAQLRGKLGPGGRQPHGEDETRQQDKRRSTKASPLQSPLLPCLGDIAAA